MAFNLKDIEAKLNSFSDKMNEIGNQVSDALNSGASSFDGALNSVVDGIDNKMEEYVQKKEQEKLEKQVEKEKVEPTVQSETVSEPIPQPIIEPVPQPIQVSESFNGTEQVEGVSFGNSVKPNIAVDLSKDKDDPNGSVVNVDSLNKGVNLNKD